MKDKSRIFVVFAVVVLALLAVAAPILAYTGVTGSVIDSLLGQGWQHGADVYVEIVTNPYIPKLISTCELSQASGTEGDFNCAYNSQGFNHPSFVTGTLPSDGDIIRVTIDFTCTQTGNCTGGNTEGTPQTLQFTYDETTLLNSHYEAGYIRTGTGPTAVELADLSISPGSTNWGIVILVALLAAVSISVIVILRNRRSAAYIDS